MKSFETLRMGALRPKTCVIFPGALGDFICFLPALQALARATAVDLFARREFGGISPDRVAVDSIERSEISKLFRPESVEDEQVQRFFGVYESVYSWFGSRNEELCLRLQAITSGRAQVFPFRPPADRGHQTDHYLDCLDQRAAGSGAPVVALRAEAVRWCDGFWQRHSLQSRPVLVVAPGSGAREKNWPAESFRAVGEWWKEAVGGVVLVLIGPVEQERGGIEVLQGGGVAASALSLSQVAALLARSDIYLGNDSGISHLAGALGVRTVALFGPSDPRQWAPRGAKVVLLRRGIDCSPCRELTMKNCPHRACLTGLGPEEIIRALAKLPEVVTLTR